MFFYFVKSKTIVRDNWKMVGGTTPLREDRTFREPLTGARGCLALPSSKLIPPVHFEVKILFASKEDNFAFIKMRNALMPRTYNVHT
jgi:hypothetical protein